MKKLTFVLSSTLLIATAVFCLLRSARAAEDPAKLQREKGLRLHLELQRDLLQAGQTNLVAKLDQMVESMLLQEATHELRADLGVLRRLRAHGTNAIVSLEADLDGAIIFLSAFDELGPDQIKALRGVSDYRSKYPRRTDSPKTDAEVARMLDLAKKQ